jgi:hypothetical protein
MHVKLEVVCVLWTLACCTENQLLYGIIYKLRNPKQLGTKNIFKYLLCKSERIKQTYITCSQNCSDRVSIVLKSTFLQFTPKLSIQDSFAKQLQDCWDLASGSVLSCFIFIDLVSVIVQPAGVHSTLHIHSQSHQENEIAEKCF